MNIIYVCGKKIDILWYLMTVLHGIDAPDYTHTVHYMCRYITYTVLYVTVYSIIKNDNDNDTRFCPYFVVLVRRDRPVG